MPHEAFAASLTPSRRPAEILPLFCVAFLAAYVLPGGVPPFAGRASPTSPKAVTPPPHAETAPAAATTDARSLRNLEEARQRGALPAPSAPQPAPSRPAKEDVPNVPQPIRSELLTAIGGLGGVRAAFLVFESWGDFTSVVDGLRESFRRDGWTRNHRFEELAGQELPGVLLSYSRGHERCLMSVERVRETGKIETLVLYLEKGWLPPNSGF
jgi:hypothetical protein